jgi:cell division initiation protein
MTKNDTFRIVRQGYDCVEVDQALRDLREDRQLILRQIQLSKEQIIALQEQRDIVKKRYNQLVSEIAVRERASDEVSRHAVREANLIIENAKTNADIIIREAMSASRQVLVEISRISNESNVLKTELKDKLRDIEIAIEGLSLPQAPKFQNNSKEQDKF